MDHLGQASPAIPCEMHSCPYDPSACPLCPTFHPLPYLPIIPTSRQNLVDIHIHKNANNGDGDGQCAPSNAKLLLPDLGDGLVGGILQSHGEGSFGCSKGGVNSINYQEPMAITTL
mmetsp:Transcript_17960/g.48820  ORF Transcript_17960/g.48820 Transcript_17960/m.48820 type:complete len:116 (+) Transcript_17960:456-803(+)